MPLVALHEIVAFNDGPALARFAVSTGNGGRAAGV